MKIKKIYVSLAFVSLAILFSLGSEGVKAEGYKIKVGSSPVVSSAGIFLAYEKGYFTEQNLDVEITYFKNSGAPMTLLLTNGTLDVGGGNISAGLWNAIGEGMKIKLVADKGHIEKGRSYIALLVRKDFVENGTYKALKDLKGFRMGITASGVSQQIASERFLKQGGLTIDDVTFENMPYSQMNIAMENKELDGAVQLEPYLTQAQLDEIAVKVADVYDVYPNQQSAAIFYSPQFIKEHPDLAQKFMVAYLKGVRAYEKAFINGEQKAETITLLKKHIKIESDTVWNNMIPTGLNPNGFLDKQSLKEDLVWYKEHGYTEIMTNIDEVVDHSYVEKALVSLGKYEQQ